MFRPGLTVQSTYYILETPMSVQFEVEIDTPALPADPWGDEPGAAADYSIVDVIEWPESPWPAGRANEVTGAQRALLISLFSDEIAERVARMDD